MSDDLTYLKTIQQHLTEELDDPDDFPEIIQRRVPRVLKLFTIPTSVNLSNDPSSQQTVLEVMTSDRPGLLARLGRIFVEFEISVRKAKISNIGERVEDFFFITDSEGNAISDPVLCQKLQTAICEKLDEHIQHSN